MKRAKIYRGRGLYARLNRIEEKCNYIISRLNSRGTEPRQDEIDSIVTTLRATAKAIAKESRDERLFFADVVNRYKK